MSTERKVLHFITGIGGGGAENFLRSLVANMQGSRWQTVIVVVRVHPHEVFAEELRAMGCIIHDLDATELLKPGVWLAVRRIIAQERPDVVQTWMHHADFIGGLAAYAAGVPQVVWGVRAMEVHRNPDDSALKTFLFLQALRWSSKLLPTKIIANSTVAIDVHEAMGYPRSKMVWVPNGVNAQRFAPNEATRHETRAQLGIPSEAPVVGFVGRFHPVKDLECFFQAAVIAQTQRADLHCVLVGGREEELYPAARACFEALPKCDQVRFVPFGSATERYYPAFDVFTLCSRSEAFPNVVLEAMATGVPCVTTAAGDCAAMLKDLGDVVPCGDATALATGWLKRLALSADERAALAGKSRARALADYSMERAARQFMDVYEEVAV
jgi:glycosyltransferase involved in cell wall biosynthesis